MLLWCEDNVGTRCRALTRSGAAAKGERSDFGGGGRGFGRRCVDPRAEDSRRESRSFRPRS